MAEERICGINSNANWKNPGNWHWIDKNCFPWASEYLKTQLEGLEHVDEATRIATRVSKVEVEGDVNLNQRKGKLITIYDLVITLSWSGEAGGAKTEGKLKIPEFDHDMGPADVEFEVSCDQDSGERRKIKESARKHLTQRVRGALGGFRDALIAAHGGDVYIHSERRHEGPNAAAGYKPKPPVPSGPENVPAGSS